jgi:hypothetical protein
VPGRAQAGAGQGPRTALACVRALVCWEDRAMLAPTRCWAGAPGRARAGAGQGTGLHLHACVHWCAGRIEPC